jgi:hypothetical protein
MAYSFIAGASEVLGQNGGTTDETINSTGADFIVLAVSTDAGVGLTGGDISDNKGNTNWQLVGAGYENTNARIHTFYHVAPTVGSGHTFTVSNATNSFASMTSAAFSGSHQTAPFDDEDGANTNGTAISPAGAITPSQDNELIISAFAVDGASTVVTEPSGYTVVDSGTQASSGVNYGNFLAYKIQGSAASEDPEWTTTNTRDMATQASCFKIAAAGGLGRLILSTPA